VRLRERFLRQRRRENVGESGSGKQLLCSCLGSLGTCCRRLGIEAYEAALGNTSFVTDFLPVLIYVDLPVILAKNSWTCLDPSGTCTRRLGIKAYKATLGNARFATVFM